MPYRNGHHTARNKNAVKNQQVGYSNETKNFRPPPPRGRAVQRLEHRGETGSIPDYVQTAVAENPRLQEFVELQNSEIIRLKKRKKYGLVWDWDSVKEILAEDGRIPVLREITSKKIADKKYNVLIEGDNLHALSILNYTHKNKIDVIYIDPPYNIGKEFTYNDKLVDKKDKYKHSKWISFMYKRLKLAKNLLSKKGVIFISINDVEQGNLKIICDEIFGEQNFMTQLIWNTDGPTDNQLAIKVIHEYILVYCNDRNYANDIFASIIAPDIDSSSSVYNKKIVNTAVKNGKRNPISEIILPLGFPCEVKSLKLDKIRNDKFLKKLLAQGYHTNDLSKKYDYKKYPILLDPIVVADNKLTKPVRILSGWQNKNKIKQFIQDSFQPIIVENNLKFYLDKKGDLIYERDRNNPRLILSILRDMGMLSKEIKDMGLVFSYPKPTKLIKYLMSMSTKNSSIVLDFFAGSGTTGHAVLQLNKEDGGNRKFILCTNNENDICTDVCYPRCQKAIRGYKNPKGEKVEGLGSGLVYYKIERVEKEPDTEKSHPPLLTDANKHRIIRQVTEMLCLKEWCFERADKTDSAKSNFGIYKNKSRHFGIIYNSRPRNIRAFTKAIDGMECVKRMPTYVFSDIMSSTLKTHKKVVIRPIPTEILRVWERVFSTSNGRAD